MLGTFFGVSVGSGDPELMTLKAVKVLDRCDTIVVPISNGKTTAFDIAKQVVDFSNKTILRLEFPMVRDAIELNKVHDNHANTIMEYLRAGRDVAMVNLGDVSIYSTFSYMAERLQRHGYSVECVSGVTSFCECANRLGLSLTSMNEPIHIVPSSYSDLEGVIESKGTKVIMKTARSTARLAELLQGKQYNVCQNCGMGGESFSNSLSDSVSYFTTIIVKD